jgi:hypothetical protein
MRQPRIARLYAAMVLARLSIGIDGIATVLFLRHEGKSFAVAGAGRRCAGAGRRTWRAVRRAVDRPAERALSLSGWPLPMPPA